jgi:hypothetical protein
MKRTPLGNEPGPALTRNELRILNELERILYFPPVGAAAFPISRADGRVDRTIGSPGDPMFRRTNAGDRTTQSVDPDFQPTGKYLNQDESAERSRGGFLRTGWRAILTFFWCDRFFE